MPNSNDVAGNEKLLERVLSLLVVGASVLGGSAVLLTGEGNRTLVFSLEVFEFL